MTKVYAVTANDCAYYEGFDSYIVQMFFDKSLAETHRENAQVRQNKIYEKYNSTFELDWEIESNIAVYDKAEKAKNKFDPRAKSSDEIRYTVEEYKVK